MFQTHRRVRSGGESKPILRDVVINTYLHAYRLKMQAQRDGMRSPVSAD